MKLRVDGKDALYSEEVLAPSKPVVLLQLGQLVVFNAQDVLYKL